MKQRIVPIIVIVTLIVSFVIIGYKNINRYNDVQIIQSETLMTIGETSVSVSETKSVTEAKPETESKQKTDMKSAETKSVAETKPVETKTIAETTMAEPKLEEKARPAAVPVVTAEEAEKQNEFALFLATVKTTVVEGEIIERSELPDPQKSDYPNCRFTARFKGNTIKSGDPCPKEIALIIDGFENFSVLSTNNIEKGDKVICSIIPLERIPEEQQSTQQADDLELFLLNSYYVCSIKTIKDYSETNKQMPSSGILFSEGNEEYTSIFERQINPPIPDVIRKAQISSIQDDLRTIDGFLEGFDEKTLDIINKRFTDVWKKEQEKDRNGYNRFKRTVWRNIDNSFWTLPEDYILLKAPSFMSKKMLMCFQSLKRACESNGVQLIVSLVPNYYDISARVINKEFRDIPDLQTATYVKQLLEIGVETIYASTQIIKNYNKFPFAFFYPNNYHPGDTTQDILSDLLAERILRYGLESELNPDLFSESEYSPVYGSERYLFPPNCDIGDNQKGETYLFRRILYDGHTIPNTKKSPIFVIGNSFIQTPVSPPESLPVLLSYKLHSPIHWERRDGFGPFCEFLTDLLSKPDYYLNNKRVLIMQVGTDHITTVADNESMIDISSIDRELILLNNKTMKHRFVLSSNTTEDISSDINLWGPLSNQKKEVFCIDSSGEMIFNVDLNSKDIIISDSEPIVCVVSHTCSSKTFCQLTINNVSKTMYYSNYTINTKFFNLSFELPAGTREITIRVEGKPGSIFAIKDIQLWQ